VNKVELKSIKRISELADLMKKGRATSEEIVKLYVENIYEEKLDKKVFKSLWEEEAIKRAKEIDERRKNGHNPGPLAGIPIALTEDISTKGKLTEAGSKILEGYVPPYDATLVKKLIEAGGIIVGKVKISEFNLEGGEYSAKCLLAGGAMAVIGSSGSGKESSEKGLVKLNPGYGLVSRYGVISASSSLSPLTIMAKDAEDLDLILDAIKGYDKMDSTSIDLKSVNLEGFESEDFRCVGPVKLLTPISEPIKTAFVTSMEKLGIDISEISIESAKYILPAYKILFSAEFASAAARYDGIRYGHRAKDYENREELYKNTRSEGFGKEAKKTILFGNHVINAGQYDLYYKKSQQIRSLIKEEIDEILKDNSVLMILPNALDETLKESYRELGSMTGHPMISMPYKVEQGNKTCENDYLELYLLGSRFKEKALIQLAMKLAVLDHEVEKGLDSDGGGR
jgi:aspartyl-tRNA(Asn)/glutamyl-tRNA(Gln) amidotransferase subunit A